MPSPSFQHQTLAAVAALLFAASTPAQVAPDAGQALRELQRNPGAATPRPAPALHLPAEADAPAADAGLSFVVQEIRIDGARAIPVATLQPLLADLTGRAVTLGALRAGVARITAHYRARGFLLARAYVPAQAMADGRLRVQVLEGTLDGVVLDNRSLLHEPRLQAMAEAPLVRGEALHAVAVERALLLVADLPGAGAVEGSLRPGAEVGSSELLVQVAPGSRVEGDVRLDNLGNRYTGAQRLSTRVALNGPAGLGDQLELRATASDRRLWYGRLAYELAVGHGGLRLGASLQRSGYTLAREFASLEASGTADSAGLSARYPLLRSLGSSVWLSGQLERRRLHDRSGTQPDTVRKSAEALVLELHGERQWERDGLPSRSGRVNWNLGATAGRLELAQPTPAAPGGRYAKLQYGARLQLPLAQASELLLALHGQHSGSSLDSSEKLTLGGGHGVRAYPSGEGLGDSGATASVELWQHLGPALQAGVFLDQGHVRLHSAAEPAVGATSRTLRGHGLAARGSVAALHWNLALAWRHDGPAASTAPERRTRLWFGLGYAY